MNEEPLLGGNVGTVVRVGDTVRRATGPWTPAVHDLLRHLERVGFAYAPRVLGIDDQGREVLTYIHGATVGESQPWPAWAWSDTTLAQTAAIMREFHDAIAEYRPVGEQVWRFGTAALDVDEVICHNDIAPYNIVVRDGRVVGIIDWDLAGPATPRWDLAFAAWSFAPLHTADHARSLGAPSDASRRLGLICDCYHLSDRSGFIALIGDRMDASVEAIEAQAVLGDAAFARLITDGHVARMVADRAELAAHADAWISALASP